MSLLTSPERGIPLVETLRTVAPEETRRVEVVLERADGTPVRTVATVVNRLEDPAVEGYVVTVRDVTAEQEHAAEIALHVLHDPVTGLANRRLFTERLVQALTSRHGHEDSLVVLICDLDDFKTVNDRHGHATGDELLGLVGQTIAATLAPGDTAARLGGDEFAVLLESRTAEQAVEVAHRIVRALSQPIRLSVHHGRRPRQRGGRAGPARPHQRGGDAPQRRRRDVLGQGPRQVAPWPSTTPSSTSRRSTG